MSLSGKTCLVSGANSNLGFAVSKIFAAEHAETIMLCRNKAKGDDAIHKIKKAIPDASVKLMICDLSSMKSIRNFIDEFRKNYSKLDILYNNAAVMKKKRTLTEDGFEMMFQVNYLAPFILMNSLLDQLEKGSSPYIINNGRPSYKLRLDMDDLQFQKNYSMYTSFFKTKLCLLFASLELSRRDIRDGVTVTMIDPGPFKSELVRDVPIMGWAKNLFSAPVSKAADNILFHIRVDEAETKNGKVFKEKKEQPLSDYWKDISISKKLWDDTKIMIKEMF